MILLSLYAISDLHLAVDASKPMDVFGSIWLRHDEKIKRNWLEKICEDDTVLIAGDISWSMKMQEGIRELDWINDLPGRKFLIKGNHDYWWTSISKLNELYPDLKFIQNNFFCYEDYAICGSRGWNCPSGDNFTSHDEKIYRRELIRFRLSLESASNKGYKKIIAMLHYPPFNEKFEDSGFTELCREFHVEKLIYGHLHGPSLTNVFEGIKNETEYILTSCDYIDFNPIKIL